MTAPDMLDTLAAVRAALHRAHLPTRLVEAGTLPGTYRLTAVTGGHAALYAHRSATAPTYWTWARYSADGDQDADSDGRKLDLPAAIGDLADWLVTRHVRLAEHGAVHAARDLADGSVRTRCGAARTPDRVEAADDTPIGCRLCRRWDGYQSAGPTRWNGDLPATRPQPRRGYASEALLARLRGDDRIPWLPDGTYLQRLSPSRAQRVQGAWSWHAWHDDPTPMPQHRTLPSIGSQWPMRVLASAPRLDINRDRLGDIHVDPDPIPTVTS